GASAARDRLHVDAPVDVGHWRQPGGEVPPPAARVRDARLPASRVQDRRAERAGAGRPRGAPGELRRRSPQAHARAQRRPPRLRLVLRDRRRMARGARSAGVATRYEAGLLTTRPASVPESFDRPTTRRPCAAFAPFT